MSVFCNMSKSYDDVTETDELIFGAPIGTILSWVPKVRDHDKFKARKSIFNFFLIRLIKQVKS